MERGERIAVSFFSSHVVFCFVFFTWNLREKFPFMKSMAEVLEGPQWHLMMDWAWEIISWWIFSLRSVCSRHRDGLVTVVVEVVGVVVIKVVVVEVVIIVVVVLTS